VGGLPEPAVGVRPPGEGADVGDEDQGTTMPHATRGREPGATRACQPLNRARLAARPPSAPQPAAPDVAGTGEPAENKANSASPQACNSRPATPFSSLITRAAEQSAIETPAPPAPYRHPNPYRKQGKHDVPRTGVMK